MDTHKRPHHWQRWTASVDEVHDLARTAEEAAGEHLGKSGPQTWIVVHLSDREVEFSSADAFVRGFGAEDLEKFRALTISVSDISVPRTVEVQVRLGATMDAANLDVQGSSRSAVDAVLARLLEKMERGRRRLDVSTFKLRQAARAAGGLVALLAGVGVMALAGVFSSAWWVIVLSALGALAFAAGVAVTAGRVARHLAPRLELRRPGQQTAWERFRAGSLRNTERLAWLLVGAGLTILVNLLT